VSITIEGASGVDNGLKTIDKSVCQYTQNPFLFNFSSTEKCEVQPVRLP